MNIKNGERWYSASEYDALQAQRDELLEALHKISTRYFPSDNAIELMRALARTAIRRVEGK